MTEVNMRNAFLSILAGLLLLGAPGAAAAGSCQSANGCAMLEHDATANAKKAVLVDASGDTAMDATANAVKTVVVDSVGAALVGGRGSRVELLASGTDTTLASTSTVLFSTTTGGVVNTALPAWCHSVVFEYRINSFDDGAATAANIQLQFSNNDASGNTVMTANWLTTTAVAPAATSGMSLFLGNMVQSVTIGVTTPAGGGTGTIGYCPFLWRNFKITRLYGVAPAVDGAVSAPWRLYCVG